MTDDTTSVRAAIAAAAFSGCPAPLPSGILNITSPIQLTAPYHRIIGAGKGSTTLKACGNFSSVFSVTPSVLHLDMSDLAIDQTGTTTQCLNIGVRESGSLPLDFERVRFVGDMNGTNGSLVYCGGVLVQFMRCVWSPNNPLLTCLQFDMNNENSSVSGCTILGRGCGINLTKTGGDIGPQGVRINDSVMACFGAAYNIHVGGKSANTYISNCVLDQAAVNSIIIDQGSAAVSVRGGWAGLAAGSSGQSILIGPTASMVTIDGVQIYGGGLNILVEGDASERMRGLKIINNDFAGAKYAAMQLDSVNGCTITGNRDYNVNTLPSLVVERSSPNGGVYIVGGNAFTSTPAILDPKSMYENAGAGTGWSL